MQGDADDYPRMEAPMKLPAPYILEKAFASLAGMKPSDDLLDLIYTDPAFNEWTKACLAQPIGNCILGSIELGWRLHEKVAELEQKELIHRI